MGGPLPQPLHSDRDPSGSATSGRVLLGRFRIERSLGQGGMGEVLLAHDELLHRRVALKRLHSGDDRGDERRAAILKEARRASQVVDPRIATIYDVLELEGDVLLVMEFVEGETLRARLARPVALEEFWRWAPQCAEALAALHAHGMIHRDIKPENLMLTGAGHLKLLDFGLAMRTGTTTTTDTTFTSANPGTIAGTLSYMSPEACMGGALDARTDIFSLGVVFHELLTGHKPFDGENGGVVMGRILHLEPPPVLDRNPAAGAELSQLVERMLAKAPADRVPSAAVLSSELARVRSGALAPAARAAASASAAPVASQLRGVPWGTLAIVGGLAVTLGVVFASNWFPPALPADRNVAVLTPRNPGGSADFASFALGATEFLNTRLRRHSETPGFQTASFTEGFDEGVASAIDARKVLGTTLALIPTFEQRPDVLRARLDLVHTGRGRTIASRTIEVPAAEPFQLLDQLYRGAAEMLQLEPAANGTAVESGIAGAGTLRFYLQGLGRLRAAKTEADAVLAVKDLELASRTEPEAAAPRASLAAAELRAHAISDDSTWLAKAKATAREAIALDSARAEPHRMLAGVLSAERDQRGALHELAIAAALDPTSDDVVSRLGRTYGRLGDADQERKVYAGAIQRRPHCWTPYWWLATWHYRQGHVDEAAATYRELIRHAPALYRGYSSLGAVLVLRGDYAAGIDTLKRSVALRPSKEAFINLGNAYFYSNRGADAVAAFNQSFQFGEAGYDSWLNLGDAYFYLRHNRKDAASAYAQAVRLGRDEIGARAHQGRSAYAVIPANLATVFPKLGQPDSARVYLARALAADSSNSMVHYCAALTYWQLGEKARAMEWLQKSVHGGFPVMSIRDSPVFDEWRQEPAFRSLTSDPGTAASQAATQP